MAHIGLSDIENALKSSGLPLGNASDMQDVAPLAGQAIDAAVPRNTVGDFGFKQKLDQIAQMDKKLAGLYSDPNSQMYIENPMAREQLIGGASQTGYSQAGDLKQQQVRAQQESDREREDLINQTEQYYKGLIAIQLREERALKKKKGTASGKMTAIEELSGFDNPKAAKVWRSQLTADQKKRWAFAVGNNTPLENSARVGDGMVPEGGYTEEDVMDFYENEKKIADQKKADAEKKKKEKETKKETNSDVLQELMSKL